MTEVQDLSFDLYQRYRLVSDLLAALRAGGPPLRVLDVGGGAARLVAFLPDEEITVCDPQPAEVPGAVRASGAALPFADASFDVVCALDTFDRLPPSERSGFAAECHRVARRWIVLSNAWRDPRVTEAEALLASFRREKLGRRDGELAAARREPLPERAALEDELRAWGCRVRSLGHGNLDRWLLAQCATSYLDEDPSLGGLARCFHRFYNESLYASDHGEPVYRHVVVAAKGLAPLPGFEDLGLESSPAPLSAVGGLAELGLELAAFDREREAWRTEREEWRRAVDDLRGALEGYGRALAEERGRRESMERFGAELEVELETQKADATQVRRTLEAELGQHSQLVARMRFERDKLEEQVAAVGRELTHRLEASFRLRCEMEREKEQHRGVIAELGEELGRLRTELEVRRREQDRASGLVDAERAQLLGEIERLRGEVEQGSERLARAEEAHEALARTLAAREAELASLQRALDDRLANLQRVLGLGSRRARSA